MPFSVAMRSIARMSGWMVGSPPLNWTTSGSPSSSTKRSSIRSTCAIDRLKPRLSVREADRAVEVAVAVDLNEAQAGVLLMLRAETAVQRTAVHHLGAEPQRHRARLVVAQGAEVHLGVRAEQRLEPAVGWAPLPHNDPAALEQHLGIDRVQAPGAYAPGQLVEDIVRVTLDLLRHISTSPVSLQPHDPGDPRCSRGLYAHRRTLSIIIRCAPACARSPLPQTASMGCGCRHPCLRYVRRPNIVRDAKGSRESGVSDHR